MWGLNAFSFQAGVIMAHLNLKEKICKRLLITAMAVFATMFILTYKILGNPDALIAKNPLKSIIALAFIMTISTAAMIYQDKLNKINVLKVVGKYSFYIYLVHAFYIYTFNSISYNSNGLIAVSLLILVLLVLCPLLKWSDESVRRRIGL